jgi:hypothetical protein
MTLKVAVVYVQGSAGNLLARALSLSEQTIPYCKKEDALLQHNMDMSVSDRFKLYSNWDHSNWQLGETEIGMWYRHGLNDFVNYEKSSKHAVCQFHPAEFCNENFRKVLWNDISAWENILLIDFEDESLDKIIESATKKRANLDHKSQIYSNELAKFSLIKQDVKELILVRWEDLLNLDSFVNVIHTVSKQIGLSDINNEFVIKLWEKWKYESDILNESKLL